MAKITTNILHYSIAVILSKAIGAATTFFIARLLLPAEYGIWMILTLIISYSTILCLGTVETLVKQVPFYIGEKNYDMLQRVDSGVLGSIFFSSGILVVSSIGIFIINFFTKGIPSPRYVQITLFTAAISLFSCFFYYRLTAFSHFKEVSFLNSSRAFITFGVLTILGWKWHLNGMVIGVLCVEISILVFSIKLNKKIDLPFIPIFNARLFWDLIKIGFPITLVWWGYVIMTSIDRIVSMTMIGKTATGFYSLGTSIVSILVLVPMAIGQVLYPHVNELVGKKTSNDELSNFIIFPTRAMILLIPLGLGCLFFITPFIYQNIFPKYTPGIHSAQILLYGAFFICIIKNGINYLVALDKQAQVFVYVIISFLISVLASIAAIKMNFNIEGVAFGTVVGSFSLTTMVWTSVFKNLGHPLAIRLLMVGQLYTPFLIISTLTFLIIILTRNSYSLNFIILDCILFFIFYIVFIFAIPFLRTWNFNLFKRIRQMV